MSGEAFQPPHNILKQLDKALIFITQIYITNIYDHFVSAFICLCSSGVCVCCFKRIHGTQQHLFYMNSVSTLKRTHASIVRAKTLTKSNILNFCLLRALRAASRHTLTAKYFHWRCQCIVQ